MELERFLDRRTELQREGKKSEGNRALGGGRGRKSERVREMGREEERERTEVGREEERARE